MNYRLLKDYPFSEKNEIITIHAGEIFNPVRPGYYSDNLHLIEADKIENNPDWPASVIDWPNGKYVRFIDEPVVIPPISKNKIYVIINRGYTDLTNERVLIIRDDNGVVQYFSEEYFATATESEYLEQCEQEEESEIKRIANKYYKKHAINGVIPYIAIEDAVREARSGCGKRL